MLQTAPISAQLEDKSGVPISKSGLPISRAPISAHLSEAENESLEVESLREIKSDRMVVRLTRRADNLAGSSRIERGFAQDSLEELARNGS